MTQNECQISLNTVDNVEAFTSDINNGRWEAVLPQIATLKLPRFKIEDLYEQVVLELVELRETDTARALLRQTLAFTSLKVEHPDRHLKLERLCNSDYIDTKNIYGDISREKRRSRIAQALSVEVTSVPPARLMTVIGQALRWQQSQGLVPPGAAYDIFRGSTQTARDAVDAPVVELDKVITFGAKSYAECATFSPDGSLLVTGSVDGFIEVWEPQTGRLRKDLPYQAEEKFMMHESAILALAFSHDSGLLASGSQDGKIKVWRIGSGQCLRRYDSAHSEGITSLAFSPDCIQVLSTSYDGLIRVHGIKSGKLLKEFRGHESYVNHATFSSDGSRVISSSSDGSVRIWDSKSSDCLTVLKPPQQNAALEVAVNLTLLNPQNQDQLIVSVRGPVVHIMNIQGQIVKSLPITVDSLDASRQPDIVSVAPSPRGDFINCLAEDGNLYIISMEHGKVDSVVKVADKDPITVIQHPHRNMVATCADGALKTWKA